MFHNNLNVQGITNIGTLIATDTTDGVTVTRTRSVEAGGTVEVEYAASR